MRVLESGSGAAVKYTLRYRLAGRDAKPGDRIRLPWAIARHTVWTGYTGDEPHHHCAALVPVQPFRLVMRALVLFKEFVQSVRFYAQNEAEIPQTLPSIPSKVYAPANEPATFIPTHIKTWEQAREGHT